MAHTEFFLMYFAKISLFDFNGNSVQREVKSNTLDLAVISKGNHKHFMEKEIFHQPISMEDTILNFADQKNSSIFFPENEIDFSDVSNLILVACGTAYHSCMIAKYWFEQLTGILTTIDIGSEYRYRKDKPIKNSIGIEIGRAHV